MLASSLEVNGIKANAHANNSLCVLHAADEVTIHMDGVEDCHNGCLFQQIGRDIGRVLGTNTNDAEEALMAHNPGR